MVEADIGEDGSGTEMRLVTQDRVTDVVEVWDLRFVKDEAALELAGVPQDDAIPHQNILPDVGAVTDLAILADPGGSLDHGTILNDGASSDIDRSADERLADQLTIDAGLEAELEIGRDLCDCLPDMSDILKDDTVLGAVEIEEGVGGEHGERMVYEL